MPERFKGTVEFFNNAKGWGFIKRDDGEKDLFVHHSCIDMEGYRQLRDGQAVEFELEQGPKGLQATHVTVIG